MAKKKKKEEKDDLGLENQIVIINNIDPPGKESLKAPRTVLTLERQRSLVTLRIPLQR